MKKLLLLLVLLFVATGCSEVTDVVNKVTDGATYIQNVTDFATDGLNVYKEGPTLLEQSVTDPAASEQLMVKLKDLQDDLIEIKELHPPKALESVDQQILSLEEPIKEAIALLEKGDYTKKEIEVFSSKFTEAFKPIQEILDKIKNFQL